MQLGRMVNKLEDIDIGDTRPLVEDIVNRVREASNGKIQFGHYGCMDYGDMTEELGGLHCILFKIVNWEEGTNQALTKAEAKAVVKILTEDDDGQPAAQYRWDGDDIWMFIPYYC